MNILVKDQYSQKITFKDWVDETYKQEQTHIYLSSTERFTISIYIIFTIIVSRSFQTRYSTFKSKL